MADVKCEKTTKPETKTNSEKVEEPNKSFVDAVKEKATGAFHFVAGGDGEKGLVGTLKEKATDAYHFVADKVVDAKDSMATDKNKDATNAAPKAQPEK